MNNKLIKEANQLFEQYHTLFEELVEEINDPSDSYCCSTILEELDNCLSSVNENIDYNIFSCDKTTCKGCEFLYGGCDRGFKYKDFLTDNDYQNQIDILKNAIKKLNRIDSFITNLSNQINAFCKNFKEDQNGLNK